MQSEGSEVPAWADEELRTMGGLSRREIILAVLVLLALAMWIFGGDFVNATTAALIVVSLMVLTRIVSWDDILSNKQAWSTLVWFATLIALADGLNRNRLCHLVCAERVRAHGRVLANHRDGRACVRVLLLALPVREHHCTHDRHAACHARGRWCNP
jgi:Sodium:sulfate symporter transmembrane region